MRAPYLYSIKEEPLFCRNCSAVTKHALNGRESFALDDPELIKESLLAECVICDEEQVVFARDLRSICGEDPDQFSCKIGGRGRIVVGDWVFFPGQSRPGQVKLRQSMGEREHFTIIYDDGQEFKWSQKIPNIAGKEALLTYKLLPFQLGSAKIGDYVYHVGRDITGITVGVVHGSHEKIIIQLENHSYLVMNLNHRNSPTDTNKALREKISEAFKSVMGNQYAGINTEVRGGMVYVSGKCGHLLEREALIKFVESIEGVLMVLPKIKILPEIDVTDEELQWQIHTLLSEQSRHGLVGVRVFVNQGTASIHGFVDNEKTYDAIYNQIACINGLKDINLNLSPTKGLQHEDIQRSRQVNEVLAKNNALSDCVIHAKCRGGKITLEGTVRSAFQKSTASLATAWVSKNMNIENNIKIEKPYPNSQASSSNK